jgi:hypothetical protein
MFLLFQSLEKIDLLLASAMMNLLHNHDIEFDNSDHVANWTSECSLGVTIGDLPRYLDKNLDFSCKLNTIDTDRSNMEWDSSCGVFGISYFAGVSHKKLEERASSNVQKDISELDSVWDDSDFESPWTWEGAPEFKDWSFHGRKATEIATIEYVQCIFPFNT